MPKLPASLLSPASLGEWAIYWARRGYPVFPLAVKGKEPLIGKRDGGHGKDDATLDEQVIRAWWERWPDANIGGRVDGRIALDIDPKNGATWEQVAQLTGGSRHLSGRGDGGGHLIYRLTKTQQLEVARVKQTKYADGIDIRIDTRGYLVLPPSIHPEGKQEPYRVESDRDDYLPEPAWAVLLGRASEVKAGETKKGTGGEVRSLLTNLLEHVPVRGDGKANDWLTAVCGHYAKQYAKQEDLYLLHAREAAGKLKPGLSDAEKAIASIWRKEQGKKDQQQRAIEQADAENGWLIGTGRELLCPVKVKQGEETVLLAGGWADFDLQARGVVLGVDSKAAEWVVSLTRSRDGVTLDTTIGADILSDGRRLAAWCAGWRIGIAPPERGQTGRGTPGTRLLRYLEAQKPSPVRLVERLGWDEATKGFVTHEGVITATECLTLDQASVYPAQRLAKDAQFYYGFDASRTEALRRLAEVLTFQDETVSSVFGSWWALCLIKGQLMKHLSQFPGMAIEAASESGKTTGFFDSMLQLAGSQNKPGMPTYAVIRDRVGAHRSGVVWMDDREDLEPYHEVFRAAPMEAAISKKGENRVDTLDFTMVAPILLTGEALGISDQKALADRFVSIQLPGGVKQRKSQRPGVGGERLQWSDILELRESYPDGLGGLTVLAGWLVQEALKHAEPVTRLIKSLQHGSGRWGDTMTLIRVGARLLDLMLSDIPEVREDTATTHAQRVDAWVVEQTDPGEENTLTKLVLPAALRAYGNPDGPEFEPLGRGSVTTPVFIDKDGTVRYRVELLADWWASHRRGQVRMRTESADALGSQADRVSVGSQGSRPVRIRNAPGRMLARYRSLSPALSRLVLERAYGQVSEDTPTPRNQGVTSPLPQLTLSSIIDDDKW